MRFWILFLALALAGCQTAAQVDAARSERLNQYVGLTIADFIARTGMAPSDMTKTAEGRSFIVLGPTVTMGYPAVYGPYGISAAPAVAQSQTCRIILDAVRISREEMPSSWRITSVTTYGPCDNAL